MNGIIWLASYPRSGNTWFRIFLSNLVNDSDTPVHFNSLKINDFAADRLLFEEVVGVKATDLLFDEIDVLRPHVYEAIARESEAIRFMKIHDAYTFTQKGTPLIPVEGTSGVLYFIRNPLDIAVSFAHQNRIGIDEMIEKMANENLSFCGDSDRLNLHLRQRLLTWSGHVLSWVDAPQLRIRVIRYEDMLSHTLETFTKAVEFVGLPNTPERIEKALASSNMEILRRQEKMSTFKEKNPRASCFFRKGQAGSWKKVLTPKQVARIVNDHKSVMKRFGYLTKDNQSIR